MLRPFAAALVLIAPLAAHAADSQGRFATKGAGRVTCAQFVTARSENTELYQRFLGWLEGYVTAVNQISPETFDVTSFESIDVMAAVIQSNCKKNPQVNFTRIAHLMVEAIREDRLLEASPLVEARVGEQSVQIYRETLRRVQRELADGGYFAGDINGLFGEDSIKALEAFQADRNLTVTGIPDALTMLAIFRDFSPPAAVE